jgi:hypothetical protein
LDIEALSYIRMLLEARDGRKGRPGAAHTGAGRKTRWAGLPAFPARAGEFCAAQERDLVISVMLLLTALK